MSTIFSAGASRVLDELEENPPNSRLLEAVWDIIDRVTELPGNASARRRALRTPAGHTVWLVPIPVLVDGEQWVILWQPRGDDSLIAYIGPENFRPK